MEKPAPKHNLSTSPATASRRLEPPPLPPPSFPGTGVATPVTSSKAAPAPSSGSAVAAVALPAAALPPQSEHATGVEQLSTVELIKNITGEVTHLVSKEIELAKTELKADLKAEAVMVGGLSLAAIGGLCTLNLLLVTAVLALALVLPGWLSGLIISGATLLITAIIAGVAWRMRVRSPLARTQRTLKDDVQWTRERLV